MSILRPRGLEPPRDRDFASCAALLGVASCLRRALRIRLPDHDAAVAVDEHLLPILDLEQGRARADDHRQAKRARDDRCMCRHATSRQRDSAHGGRELRDIRRSERISDEHSVGYPGRAACEICRRATADAAHVVGPLRQHGVRQHG